LVKEKEDQQKNLLINILLKKNLIGVKVDNMANEQNLKPFKKGFDEKRNINGRPRKYVSNLKDQGYKMAEVNDAIQVLMSMTQKELTEVSTNPDATVLEMTVSKAMLKSMKNGSLYSLDTLLTRSFGKPKETVDTNINGELKAKIEVVVTSSSVPLSNRETDVDVTR
jgi:hypothetical protein